MASLLPGSKLLKFFSRVRARKQPSPKSDRKGYVTVKIPDEINWEVWRIVSSERYSASLVEVETLWSLDDLLDAHMVLDLLESHG